MSTLTTFTVGSYTLASDLYYDPETHVWVSIDDDGTARIGFDPLGAETSGDIVATAFERIGAAVERGRPFGSIEAAKFVGPVVSPITGTVRAHNEEVLRNPALLNESPFEHWMIEIEPSALAEESAALLTGEEEVRAWFEAEVARFRSRGMLAE